MAEVMLLEPSTAMRRMSGAGAFGHPGAGGSLAFADLGRGWSFAYVMNQMEVGALPGKRTLALVEAVDGAVDGLSA